jgi:protein-L-isoaspartate(D-aspartate) O-methyltransferase
MKQLSPPSPQDRMVQEQLIGRGIRDARVIAAMRAIPREHFFPSQIRQHAHADKAAPIGHGQTISQPYMVALMTQRLALSGSERVLELGTGSGYHAAIIASIAAEVYTVERVKPLLDEAFERILSLNLRNVHFRYGDGTTGWPGKAPFDRILITAGAPGLPRDLLLSNLADGGLAILPVGAQEHQMLVEVHRHGDELASTDICACRFVKLIGQEAWKEREDPPKTPSR